MEKNLMLRRKHIMKLEEFVSSGVESVKKMCLEDDGLPRECWVGMFANANVIMGECFRYFFELTKEPDSGVTREMISDITLECTVRICKKVLETKENK
uniref:Uncharacterized protein n=1 Tax=viral metagenome TaxID=1070528 RepID=A0A6M3LIA3_9ZZZZ